jgi:DNA helicase-2/ATP-dependent DNA helicase PcrA
VGGATADKLWREFQPLLKADLGAPVGRALPEHSPAVPKRAADDWKQLAAVINQLRALPPPLLADEMIEVVIEGYYETYLKAKYPNARARTEDLNQLAAFGTQFKLVEEFLSQLALLTNLEADDASLISSGEQEFLRMSTVHQAKGQEWKVVFVIGLCDGMFPLSRSLDNLEGEEEERRLFYVAVTRAKDELFLTFPLYRPSSGDTGGFQRPSRFVAELPKEHYQELLLRHQGAGW